MTERVKNLKKHTERKWVPTRFAGIEQSVLHIDEANRGGTALLRFAPGARFPLHTHPGGEENYVLEGELVFSGEVVCKDGYLFTPPGASHDVTANVESIVLVSAPKGVSIIEESDTEPQE